MIWLRLYLSQQLFPADPRLCPSVKFRLCLSPRLFFLLFCIFFGYLQYSFAQTDLPFIENKGQWGKNILFKANLPVGDLYLEKNCLTFNLFLKEDRHHKHQSSTQENEPNSNNYHAYRMTFLNSDENCKINKTQQSKDCENYFIGKNESDWASDIRKYAEISYVGFYDKIDLRIFKNKDFYEYEFIVSPEGKTDNIQIQYSGQDKLLLKDGNLIIKNTVCDVTEMKPVAYQEINGKKKIIECNFLLSDSTVWFDLPNGYNKSYPLIIDPVLVFSTYSGSTADNWGFTATYDNLGNVYSGGIVWGTGYPVSLGIFQGNYAGDWDIGVIKYTPDGTTRLWATYLGGSSSEMPHSMVVDQYNNLLVFGTTGSQNFPISSGAYDNTFNGGTSITFDYSVTMANGVDLFITKLSEDGSTLAGSTFIGGTGNDGFNFKPYLNYDVPRMMQGNDSLYFNYGDGSRGEIICDSKNNVFVGTCTFSNDFPVTPNAFQQSNHGMEEGVVFKINGSLTQMIWSSYIGGSQDDAIYSLDLDNSDNVYVCGGAVSHDFPTTTGAYSTIFNGGTTDGFVSKISLDGGTLLASSFFGSTTYDQAYFVKLDKANNAYIAGQTKASGSTLVNNVLYSVPNSGQFIAKFNPALSSLQWSTVFGTGIGRPNISITAFTVDVCSRIYLSGWGREWAGYSSGMDWNTIQGTKNMPVTSNAYQSATDGQDFYVMVLSDDASQLEYGSYFGEQHSVCTNGGYDHVDGGTSRFDKKGNIYQSVCGSCGGCNNFPTFPGNVWSQTNNSYNCNNAVFRFTFMGDFSVADFILPPSGCQPYTINFTNTSIGANYHWDFGDGTSSTDQNPTHTYSQSGLYSVTLIASDPVTCNLADTIIKQIQVLSNSNDTLAIAQTCIGDSIQIGVPTSFDPNVTYHWFPQAGLSNPYISNPWAILNNTTEYLLVITNGTCSDSLHQTVNVQIGNYDLAARNDTIICSGTGIELFATTSFSTSSFLWSNSLNFQTHLNSNTSISNFNVNPTVTTTYYIKGNGIGCEGFDIDSITVQINQVAILAGPDTSICVGDTVTLHAQNLIPGNTLSYQWFPSAAIISGANTANAVISPVGTINYFLIATSQYTCSRTDTIHVAVNSVTVTPITQNVNCHGDCNGTASVATIGAYPLQYFWNNSSTDSTLTNLCPGAYQVTVTDSWGCKNNTSIQVGEPQLLVANLQITPILVCNGFCTGQMTAEPSGGTTPYYYHWSNNSSNDTILNICVGGYMVTVSDAHGCDTILSGQIVDPSTLQTTILAVSSISCHDFCNGAITVVATGGQQPLTYHWNNNETVQTIDSLCSGNYTVSVIDADNCIRINNYSVAQPQALNPFIHAQSSINCHDDTTSLYAIVSNGFPPYTFLWNDSLHQTTQTIHGISAGIYQVIIHDFHNCPDTALITLPNPALLIADTASRYASCTISCDGIIHLNPNGGTPPYSITWNNQTHDTLRMHLCPGNYIATISDANGCRLIRQFHIDTLGYAPYLEASADDIIIYRGRSTTLHANGSSNSSYTWAPATYLNDASSENPNAYPLYTTHYLVWTIDSTGCKSSDTITIFVEDVLCREPYIFIPNAFTPNGDNNNDVLFIQTNMADKVYFAVYDRWGELVFESTNVLYGWDGTYNGKMLDPAVFVYYLKVTCLNGEIFEKNGNVTMLK